MQYLTRPNMQQNTFLDDYYCLPPSCLPSFILETQHVDHDSWSCLKQLLGLFDCSSCNLKKEMRQHYSVWHSGLSCPHATSVANEVPRRQIPAYLSGELRSVM